MADALGTFYNGGKPGRRTAVTPKSLSANAAKRSIQRVISLGTGSVTTATYLVGIMPVKGKVVRIDFAGQAAVTGTSLTADVRKLSSDGNTATTLQSAATDIKLTASTDEVAQAASLTATVANRTVDANLVLEVVITASSITAGPGDLVVNVVYVPVEDSESNNTIEIGADLL